MIHCLEKHIRFIRCRGIHNQVMFLRSTQNKSDDASFWRPFVQDNHMHVDELVTAKDSRQKKPFFSLRLPWATDTSRK